MLSSWSVRKLWNSGLLLPSRKEPSYFIVSFLTRRLLLQAWEGFILNIRWDGKLLGSIRVSQLLLRPTLLKIVRESWLYSRQLIREARRSAIKMKLASVRGQFRRRVGASLELTSESISLILRLRMLLQWLQFLPREASSILRFKIKL
jgi:hypothetical protein